jgi:hypothetical protein
MIVYVCTQSVPPYYKGQELTEVPENVMRFFVPTNVSEPTKQLTFKEMKEGK